MDIKITLLLSRIPQDGPKVSKLVQCYGCILLAVFGGLLYKAVDIRIAHSGERTFDLVNDLFVLIFGYCLLLVAIGLPIIKANVVADIVVKFAEVDALFDELKISVDHSRTRRKVLVHLFFFFVTCSVVTAIDCTSKELTNNGDLTYFFLFFHIVHLYSLLVVVDFSCFLFLLKQRIEILNRVMSHVSEGRSFKERIGDAFDEMLFESIHKVQLVHIRLIDIGQRDFVFSWQILISSTLTFVELTFNLYCFVIRIVVEGKSGSEIQRPITWFLFDTFLMLGILIPSVMTAVKGDETSFITHDLMLKIRNPFIQNQLSLFSSQLLQHKFCFSAAGFFDLDMTLIVSMTGAVTTYLVVLVQFAMSE